MMSLEEIGHFIYSFLICLLFSCFIALARANKILNRHGKNGHTCLISNLREKTFGLSPLGMIVDGFSKMSLVIEKISLLILVF